MEDTLNENRPSAWNPHRFAPKRTYDAVYFTGGNPQYLLERINDTSYKSEVYGIKTAVIAHGGGSGNETAEPGGVSQKDYKAIVNDPIANALYTIQLKLMPFNNEWNTGIVVPPATISAGNGQLLDKKIGRYVRKVLDVEET